MTQARRRHHAVWSSLFSVASRSVDIAFTVKPAEAAMCSPTATTRTRADASFWALKSDRPRKTAHLRGDAALISGWSVRNLAKLD